MAIIDRSGADVLIPEENAREIIQMVPETSTVMRLMRRLPDMGTNTRMIPVLSALPMSYFVDGDIGYKQTTAQAWENVKLYAEEIACIVPIPTNVLDDSDYDIWANVLPRLTEAIGATFDKAVFFGLNKPDNFPDGIVPGAIRAGNVFGEWDPSAAEGVVYGYTLDDLDVNGIPELIIGNLADETDNKVYAVFTLSNGQPVSAAFGTDTDSWFLSKAGGLYLRREAGEMNADYVIYSFGGTKLEAFFGCFAGDGTDGSAPGYYRVAYGDRHSGTAFDVTREEFESDIESFEATIIPLSALTGV